jgi:hypothetical protein
MLNDHAIRAELERIRRGYDKQKAWTMILAIGLLCLVFYVVRTTDRVRWVERNFDRGKLLVVNEEVFEDARTAQERSERGR